MSVSNLPAGLSAVFTPESDTVMRVVLNGTADNHKNSDDIANIGITFTDAAFRWALASTVTDSSKTGIMVDFIDVELSYSTTELTESGANNGTISPGFRITLSGDKYAPGPFTATHVTATNIPSGLTANFIRDSDTQVSLLISGVAASHTDSDDISNIDITFNDAAFVNAPAANVTDSFKTGIAVDFIDVFLSYSALEFAEANLNDGSISDSIEITLSGDTYTSEVESQVIVSNIPSGLTAKITPNSDTLITLTLTGHADAHQDVDDIGNLAISFLDAFENASAATVEESSKTGIPIDFDDNPVLSYSVLEFSEDTTNDGSMMNSITITLTGDTFDADVKTNNSILVSNIPSGLTESFTRISDTQLTFSLSGNADDHEISYSISNLSIDFLDHAFVNTDYASAVFGYRKNDLKISFMDPFMVSYQIYQINEHVSRDSSTFNEDVTNDGSFTNDILVMDLYGDTFTADVVSSNLVDVYNLPTDFTAEFTRISDTQVTLNLTGAAADNEKAHNRNNITVAFKDGAFTIKSLAENVTHSTNSDIKLNFYSSVIDVSIYTYTCAVLASGEVKCWGGGANAYGAHGRGDTLADIGKVTGTMGANLGSAILGENRTAKAVFPGYANTCAILDEGQVKCWGMNAGVGLLGLEDTEDRDTVKEMNELKVVDLGPGATVSSLTA